MKVLVIGRSYPSKETGMFGTFEYDQALVLHNNGVDVRYYFIDTRPINRLHKLGSFRYENDFTTEGDYLPISNSSNPFCDLLKSKIFIRHFSKLLNEYRPDIVHIHYPSLILTEKIWHFLRKQNIGIVVTEHYSKVMLGTLPKSKYRLLKKIYTESNSVICVSSRLKQAIEMMSNRKEIDIIPNVISTEIRPKQLKLNHSTSFSFVYVGNIGGSKQVDLLLKAYSLVCKENKNTILKIIGDGPKKRLMESLVKQLGLCDRVIFYGSVSRKEVGEILLESDIFVTASRIETFCVPIVEAWYCGLPAIFSNNIPLTIYSDKENSIIFEDSDLNSLANAMKQALKLRNFINKDAISINAVKTFGSTAVGKSLIQVYEKSLRES